MMVWSLNLLVLAVGLLIVGMFKPGWILFWMEKPGRMPIVILSAVLFMVAAVMFGEANREKQTSVVKQAEQTIEKKSEAVPTIAIEAEVVSETVPSNAVETEAVKETK